MQSLTTLKTKSQEGFNRLVENAQQQPSEVKLWGVVAASALVGGVAVAATAKGVLAIVSTLAFLPVALSVGALGGGAIGWSLMQNQSAPAAAQPAIPPITVVPEAAPIV